MRLRAAALEEVREREATYQRLAELHQEQAEAVAAIVKSAVEGETDKDSGPADVTLGCSSLWE